MKRRVCTRCGAPLRTREEIGADLAGAAAKAEQLSQKGLATGNHDHRAFMLGALKVIIAPLAAELREGLCSFCAFYVFAQEGQPSPCSSDPVPAGDALRPALDGGTP